MIRTLLIGAVLAIFASSSHAQYPTYQATPYATIVYDNRPVAAPILISSAAFQGPSVVSPVDVDAILSRMAGLEKSIADLAAKVKAPPPDPAVAQKLADAARDGAMKDARIKDLETKLAKLSELESRLKTQDEMIQKLNAKMDLISAGKPVPAS